MNSRYHDILRTIEEIELTQMEQISGLASLIQSNLPIDIDDHVISITFVDLTRRPVALLSKFRSDNFRGFNVKYYNKLDENLQTITDESLVHNLIDGQNLVVIEDVSNIDEDAPVHEIEKQFMQNNNWKSVILHSLFYENVSYGYLVLFTEEEFLTEIQIDLILDYFSHILPTISRRLLSLAFKWKSNLYKKDIYELESHLSDLIVAITEEGRVVRINDVSGYYLGLKPHEILGEQLQEVCPTLYEGIMKSVEAGDNHYPFQVEIEQPTGGNVTMELSTWATDLTSDNTIVCYATDITLLKLYEGIIKDR